MNPNVKPLVKTDTGGDEKGTTVSTAICKTRWRLCHGLGLHFSQFNLVKTD